MTYLGKVSNGVVVLPPEADLPEGTEVNVEPILKNDAAQTLFDKMAAFVGMANDLPADLAKNHDHYLHGHFKR